MADEKPFHNYETYRDVWNTSASTKSKADIIQPLSFGEITAFDREMAKET